MFDRVATPAELLTYELGSALAMENILLDTLGELELEATSDELVAFLRRHAEQTTQHVRTLEEAFAAIGEDPEDKPCPVIEAIDKEARAGVNRSADPLVDTVILGSAAAAEHYEIAVYDSLIVQAEALGRQDVAALIRQGLEHEQQALEDIRAIMSRIAGGAAQHASREA